MKKLRKILLVILAAIVILAVAVVALVNLFADRAVKMGIETAATKTLNVGVTINSLDLSIMAGKLTLGNLVINNPPGYQHPKLLELKQAQVEVDIRSLLSDTVKIKGIKLDGAEVVLEQRGVSGNNIQDIIKSMPSAPKTQETTPQPSGKKLHIDNLEISNITVKAKLLPIPGKADTVTLKLAPIKMTNLGGDNKLDTAALSSKILVAIANGIAEQGAGTLPDDMVGAMKSTLAKTAELGKEVIKTTEDLGKELTEGLKGLLKPKKQE
jgi:hypothetical protein